MKTRAVIATMVVMIITIGILAIGYIGTNNKQKQYSMALEDYYQRSFYELLDNVNDMEVNLSKGMICTSQEVKINAFEKIQQDCTQAVNNLSLLPINHESINETTRLVNQLGGYSYYLISKLKIGSPLTETDKEQLDTLYDYTISVQESLNDFHKGINYDFSFLLETLKENDSNLVDSTFSSMQSTATGVEYPTLIYDGPFSESTTNREIKGLSSKIITKEEGEKFIWEKMGSVFTIESIEYVSNTQGKFSTFDYKIIRKDLPDIYCQITEKGGMVININSTISEGDKKYELEECKTKAEEFAKVLDFKDLKAVWGTIINNTAYINLTTVIDDVIIYPEMIKVKVDITNGHITGWEATNYAYTYTTRTDLKASISATEARKSVDSRLKIDTQKLAIIPKDYGEDTLCYEFKCTLNNYTYYVYINAKTGVEENILRVIQTDNGELLE